VPSTTDPVVSALVSDSGKRCLHTPDLWAKREAESHVDLFYQDVPSSTRGNAQSREKTRSGKVYKQVVRSGTVTGQDGGLCLPPL
jgi:hypothetical protein